MRNEFSVTLEQHPDGISQSLWFCPVDLVCTEGNSFRGNSMGRDLSFGVRTGLGFATGALLANISTSAKENSAGIDSFPLLPRFVLLVPAFGRWAVGWGCASLPWETELRFCKFREEIWRRESKTGSISNQSLLMLELPNSVFTHQGLTLMVIYSHFLVNN